MNDMPNPVINDIIEGLSQTVVPDRNGRRAAERFDCLADQAVAPYDGTHLPTSDLFQQVQCRDLSRGGISFLWPHFPEFKRFIIKVAVSNRPMCFDARVVHCQSLNDADNRVLVGCKFLDRVHISE